MNAEPQPGELLQSGTLCFSIDGGYLARTARGLVTDGRWRDGLGLLTRGLEGISTDDALSILRGTHTLEGVNEVELVEDGTEEAAEHVALVLWQNAGLWRPSTSGLTYQPYASVGALAQQDVPPNRVFPYQNPMLAEKAKSAVAPDRLFPIDSRGDWSYREYHRELEKWSELRLLYYADTPRGDRADKATIEERGAVLWRAVVDPPLWLEPARDSKVAIAEYLAAEHRLEERGPALTGRADPETMADVPEPGFAAARSPSARRGRAKRERAKYFRTRYQAGEPLAPEDLAFMLETEIEEATREPRGFAAAAGLTGPLAVAAEAIFENMTGAPDDSKPEPDELFCGTGGYILPDGRFFSCGYMKHSALAARILRWHFNGFAAKDPQIEADKRNWLRIQPSVLGHTSFLSPKDRPTKAQKRALADWCIAHEMPYPADLS